MSKQAKSPPGWSKNVEKMKEDHSDEIDNPFALAWWMHNEGYTPHKKKVKKEAHQRKIATRSELQSELRRLLAYVRSRKPSRTRLATELSSLAARVGKLW